MTVEMMTAVDQAQPSGACGGRKILLALAMERVVGHAIQARLLEGNLACHPFVDPLAVPVTFHRDGGLPESLPLVPGYLRAAWRARLEVLRGLGGEKPDVIFWNTQKTAIFCLDLLRRVPSMISLDVTPRQYDELGEWYGHRPDGSGLVAEAKHRLNRHVFHLPRRLLPSSDWVRKSLVEDYGVPSEKIEVLPPGTDLTRFHPPDARSSPGEGKTRLLFVGGDFVRKGGDTLVEWFRTSAAARQCELHIVTRDLPETCDGIFVHRFDYEDERLPALYREADIFVMPTRAECYGLVFTEAAASGLPSITCDIGGVAEVVRDGETGLFVTPGDIAGLDQAIGTLAQNPDLRARLGRRARELAEQRFDARKYAGRVAQISLELSAEHLSRS